MSGKVFPPKYVFKSGYVEALNVVPLHSSHPVGSVGRGNIAIIPTGHLILSNPAPAVAAAEIVPLTTKLEKVPLVANSPLLAPVIAPLATLNPLVRAKVGTTVALVPFTLMEFGVNIPLNCAVLPTRLAPKLATPTKFTPALVKVIWATPSRENPYDPALNLYMPELGSSEKDKPGAAGVPSATVKPVIMPPCPVRLRLSVRAVAKSAIVVLAHNDSIVAPAETGFPLGSV
jgi:hypothetical protein